LAAIFYHCVHNTFTGEFEDGMRIIIHKEDKPSDMSVYDFITELRKGLDEDDDM
jgi:hypothetical protein